MRKIYLDVCGDDAIELRTEPGHQNGWLIATVWPNKHQEEYARILAQALEDVPETES